MPKRKEYSKEMKQLMFRIISFVESEKNGFQIPLFNTTGRLTTMLGISERSVFRLREEMVSLTEKEVQEKEEQEKGEKEEKRQLRSQTASETTISPKRSHKKKKITVNVPVPDPPRKMKNSGRKAVELNEFQQDNIRYYLNQLQNIFLRFFSIRYQFHAILSEKVYPTTEKILIRLLHEDPEFPIQSKATLLRWMKKLGFRYRQTSKTSIPLDSVYFMAQRARYFRSLDDVRNNDTIIYFHDETWVNSGEERRMIWTDSKTKAGRFRHNDTRGIGVFSYLNTTRVHRDVAFYRSSFSYFSDNEQKWISSAHSRYFQM